MAVSLTIPIYHQRQDGQIVWTTLGLGPYNQTHTGGSVVKVQRKLVDKLRRTIEELQPGELELFQLARGIELVPTRLELSIRGPDSRFKVTGVYPLIVEPRRGSDESRLLVVYHPQRQEEWFAVDHAQDIPDRATAFFRRCWSTLDQDDIEALQAGSKDAIRSISLSASPRSLLDKLPRKQQERQHAGLQTSSEVGRVLNKIGVNQTVRAMEGTLPTGMPRSLYRRQMQLLLGGTRKRSTIVVGPPGCGKTTIIYQWIADLMEADEFPVHRNLDRVHNVWTVSGKRIIAGMSMLGDWEQRCIDLLIEAKRRRAILVVEDLHLFGRLGQTRESERSLAEFFRGPVARGELIIVGECTAEKMQRLDNDAPGFAALFSRVRVQPTEPSETLQMMMHATRALELSHPVEFHPFTYRAVVELGGSLFPWSAFPGKALDMLRQLVDARASSTEQPDPRTGRIPRTEIRAADVVSLMSRQTGLPENLLTLETRMDVQAVRDSFARHVMGQPAALQAACDLVFQVRAGLVDPTRPLAVLLFTGPTGTGKTEMARCIAEYLFGSTSRLLRLDMSEYASPDAATRLIGDRYSPRGLLTQRIREQPFCVVLFDEIEKAHASVLNLLLQLFDEGRLTDALGDTASFNHAVIIMTSNLGARPQRPIGFGDAADRVLGEIDKAVRDFFPPELFNRIDKVVPFRPLSTVVAENIAVKELARLLGRRGLAERNIYVYANKAVKERIVAEAFDPAHGARTVKRYLEDHIGSLLAEEITAAGQASMRVMRVYDAQGTFRLHVEPMVETEPEDADWRLGPLLAHNALHLRDQLADFAELLDQLVERDVFTAIQSAVRENREPDELWYYADTYKQRVLGLRDWFADMQRAHRPRRKDSEPATALDRASKEELLARMADACFLSAHVDHVADRTAHIAWIEVLRVGHGRENKRFAEGASGLLEWVTDWLLASRYPDYGPSEDPGDSLVDAVAFRYTDGKIRYWQDDDCADKARESLGKRPVQVVVKLVGLCAWHAFRGEDGCHIWRSLAAEPEIVRVRVWRDPDARHVRQVILDHLAGLQAFESALESGIQPLPDNPEALIPAVRTLQFRPPLRQGEVFPVEVEDFHTSFAGSPNVRALGDVLRSLFWLRKSAHPTAAPEPAEPRPEEVP